MFLQGALCVKCRYHLENGQNLSETLQFAARLCHADCLQGLLNKGASVNSYDEFGKAALFHVAERGDQKCVKLLTEAGADVNKKTNPGVTALMIASWRGALPCVDQLIQMGADVNIEQNSGRNALMYAVRGKSVECINFLIEAGASVNSHDEHFSTALIEAVELGSIECVKSLVQSGANVNVCSISAGTPLGSSVVMNDLNTADFLVKSGAGVDFKATNELTPLMQAESRECLDLLLKAGADVNFINESGGSAVSFAARSRHSLIKPLLEAGADVNTCTAEDGPIVTVVSTLGSARTLGLLITAGADVNALNREMETPLIAAAKYNEEHGRECIKLLLKSGAKIDQVEFGEFNALHSHFSSSITSWESGEPDADICMLLFAAGEPLDGPNTLQDCLSSV